MPWSSKFQIGMSSTRLAFGVPLLTSTVMAQPSRCMWLATARIVASARTGGWRLLHRPGLQQAQQVQQVGGQGSSANRS